MEADRAKEKVLIVRLGALGDIVHTLPLARALREALPGAFLGWAVEERFREIVEADRDVDLVIPVPRRLVGGKGSLDWARRLRQERFGVALDAQGLVKSALVGLASGASRRVGFHPGDRRERVGALLTNETIPRLDRTARHVAAKNLALLGALGLRPPPAPRFPLLVEGIRAANRIALHPGAGWPSKRWPAARFAEVADWLAAKMGAEVLVTWGPGDERVAQDVASRIAAPARILEPCGPQGLARALTRCRLAVGGDTGPIHLAAALGVPAVALFGPTDPERNGPLGAAATALRVERPCRGCWRRRCPKGEDCLSAIGAPEVRAAVEATLDASWRG